MPLMPRYTGHAGCSLQAEPRGGHAAMPRGHFLSRWVLHVNENGVGRADSAALAQAERESIVRSAPADGGDRAIDLLTHSPPAFAGRSDLLACS